MTFARLAFLLALLTAPLASGNAAATAVSAGEADGAPTVPTAAAGDPHEHLDQILDRPLFKAWRLRQAARQTPELPAAEYDLEWLGKPFEWIGDFFEWLFRSPSRKPNVPSGFPGDGLPAVLKAVAWVVLGVALIFLAILLFKVLRTPAAAGAVGRVLSRQQIRAAMESGDALVLGAGQWLDEANRLAGEQDFRAVYRALYLALLSGLHTIGKIEHSRNRTNWSYVQRYRGPADERQTFGELTALFDRVWYGRKPTAGDDLDDLRNKVAALTRPGGAGDRSNAGRSKP